MIIRSSEFITSAVQPAQYPAAILPELVLAGRSNVGKSSLINCLLQRKNLARTSSKPGKTQTINFYLINKEFYMADVPGYGYAQVSKNQRLQWQKMIATYLRQGRQLRVVLMVVDLRHPPTVDDQNMFGYLQQTSLPIIVVATKADKLARTKLSAHLKVTRERLGAGENIYYQTFSAKTGWGRTELWAQLNTYLS